MSNNTPKPNNPYLGLRKVFVQYACGCIHEFYPPIPEPKSSVICVRHGVTVASCYGYSQELMRSGRYRYGH